MAVAGNSGAVWARGAGVQDGRYQGPTPAERNVLAQAPTFFHRLRRFVQGRNMNYQQERTEAPGRVRRWWQATPNEIGAGRALQWSSNAFDTDGPLSAAVSRPVRYMISSRYAPAGDLLSVPDTRAVVQRFRHAPDPVFIRAGQQQGRPTVRSRLTSFGQRVPPVNNPYPSEEV